MAGGMLALYKNHIIEVSEETESFGVYKLQ